MPDNSVISMDGTPPPPATTTLAIPQTLPTPQSTDYTHQTENIHSQHEGSSPLSSILKNSSPEQYHNIINHHNHTSPTAQTYNQTEYLSSLNILGKVRLHHYICLKGHLSGSLEKSLQPDLSKQKGKRL
jgi:hypothetical protein